jgi:hypothetical protein
VSTSSTTVDTNGTAITWRGIGFFRCEAGTNNQHTNLDIVALQFDSTLGQRVKCWRVDESICLDVVIAYIRVPVMLVLPDWRMGPGIPVVPSARSVATSVK